MPDADLLWPHVGESLLFESTVGQVIPSLHRS